MSTASPVRRVVHIPRRMPVPVKEPTVPPKEPEKKVPVPAR